MYLNAATIEDFTYIEDVLSSPLIKKYVSANDCGITQKPHKLMVNRVHPMFLKANDAASKEDKPNWWESTSGPFVDEY